MRALGVGRACAVAMLLGLGLLAPTAATAGPGGDPPPEDTSPPRILVQRPSGSVDGWHDGAVDVVLTVLDDHPGDRGVRSVTYTLSGATTAARTLTYTGVGEARVPLTISAEGSTRIDVTATDVAQHEASAREWVGVDTTAPWVDLTAPVDGTVVPVGAEVTVAYACGDATSALVACEGSHRDGERLDTSVAGSHTVTVTARDLVGHTTTRRARVTVARELTVLEAPRLVGQPIVGRTLSVTPPRTDPEPSDFGYDWRVGAVAVGSGPTLTLRPEHLGRAVTLTVWANRVGHVARTFELTGGTVRPEVDPDPDPDPDPGPDPVIVGTPTVGERLEVRHREIAPASTVTYQWLRDGEPIPGGQGSGYTLGRADTGTMVGVRVTAVSASAGTRTWSAPAVGPVAPGEDPVLPVTVTTGGTISGDPRIGRTLVARPPTWSPADATTAFQWLSDGAPIPGATGPRLVLDGSSLGTRISVRFTGTAPGRTPGTSTTAETARVGKARPVLRARYAGGTVTVTIARTGVAAGGKVAVSARGRTHTVRVRDGRAVVRVGLLSRGSRITVTYRGTALIEAARITLRR